MATPDLSGSQADGDINMGGINIMLVSDQIVDKGTYFITRSPMNSERANLDSTSVKRKDIGHSQSRYVKLW